ncbi:MAG: methylated-DNA--[protein]-cysteine S-methyltransferase [Oligoflexus sp.]|nr:methylated-DNA--[protein]-cysteine S-methyltransferase [Oligoflexus sp.]
MNHGTVFYKKWMSPIGEINLYANETSLLAVTFKENNPEVAARLGLEDHLDKTSPLIEETMRQLGEYFEGKRKTFEVPVTLIGTDFQLLAWNFLRGIPFGMALSYSEQAKKIERENAFRAVGSANGKNPISIIIPCHRILASNGKISGYAGGAAIKKRLLEIEGYRFLKVVQDSHV